MTLRGDAKKRSSSYLCFATDCKKDMAQEIPKWWGLEFQMVRGKIIRRGDLTSEQQCRKIGLDTGVPGIILELIFMLLPIESS